MKKNICPNCNTEITDNIRFCPKCGENLEKKEKSNEPEKNTVVEEITKKDKDEKELVSNKKEVNSSLKSRSKIVVLIAILILIITGILLWLLVFNKDDDNDSKKNDNEVVDKEEDNDDKTPDNDNSDIDDDSDVKELSYYGNTYVFSEGLAWLKDSSYIYLINDNGKIVNKFDGKKNDGYFDFKNSTFDDGYSMIGNALYDKNGKKVEFADEYEEIEYVGDSLLVVTTKEEDYKGTVIKKGIYDLSNNDYKFDLQEDIYRVSYLGEKMFSIGFSKDNKYIIYDTATKKSFDLGDRDDVLKSNYKDGYIMYQDTNAYEVYAIDKSGNKTLIAEDKRHAQIGQYSDGLVFINDAFYDIKGNKVIDLKDEGVSNKPMFVNGYALVFFDTGYFTVLSKETKEYMFEPKAYTSMGNTYGGSFDLGFYEDQKIISDSGNLIVRLYDEKTGTKKWAIMNVNGDIVYKFSETVDIDTVISDNGYIGVTEHSKQESYYVSVKGKMLKIDL